MFVMMLKIDSFAAKTVYAYKKLRQYAHREVNHDALGNHDEDESSK